jgi:hypothetical protein
MRPTVMIESQPADATHGGALLPRVTLHPGGSHDEFTAYQRECVLSNGTTSEVWGSRSSEFENRLRSGFHEAVRFRVSIFSEQVQRWFVHEGRGLRPWVWFSQRLNLASEIPHLVFPTGLDFVGLMARGSLRTRSRRQQNGANRRISNGRFQCLVRASHAQSSLGTKFW